MEWNVDIVEGNRAGKAHNLHLFQQNTESKGYMVLTYAHIATTVPTYGSGCNFHSLLGLRFDEKECSDASACSFLKYRPPSNWNDLARKAALIYCEQSFCYGPEPC